ncbi:MAG: hypothetical protein KGL39_18990 [Patescibacteria group bacterium]|nr:hypothetical protein [Patescibacteria group bacterium]
MHFNRKELINAVTQATRIIPKRVLQPILSCVKIQFSAAGAELIATDLDTWFRTDLNSGVATGTYQPTCIDARQLLAVLKAGTTDTVLIANAVGVVTVDGLIVESFDEADYPHMPLAQLKQPTAPIMARELQRVIDQAAFAAAAYDHYNILAGVYFKDGDVVCTDGSRMSLVTIESIHPFTALVPADALLKVIAPAIKAEVKANASLMLAELDDRRVHVQGHNWEIITRQINGEYPRYKELFPEASMQTFTTFEKQSVLAALKLIKPFLNKHTNRIVVDLQSGTMTVGDNKATFQCDLSYQLHDRLGATDPKQQIDPVFGVNFNYFLQAIESAPGDQVQMSYQAPLKPLVFECDDYRHLLMPVHYKEKEKSIA